MFQPSQYQTNVFEFVASGSGDAVVDAVPGSGKTTTCVEASKRLHSSNALFCAFNKHIATELKTRLQGMRAQTIHSLGLSALSRLGRPELDEKKYSKLIRQYVIDQNVSEIEAIRTASDRIRGLLRLTQLTLTDPEDEAALKALADRFDLDRKDWDFTWRAIAPILQDGTDLVYQVIDYNDMVWLPHALGLEPRKADWVFVDEAQDLNQAQLELVLKARARGGRMLFVGDKRQAIYGFTGADTQSIANITDRTQATVLPLSICYRCPTSHIELANTVYPGIEPRPGAPLGIVEEMDDTDIIKNVGDGDLIICRTNAPLVAVCFELIRAGIPARIRGTDIGKNLIAILHQLEEAPGFQFSRLETYLRKYLDEQRQLRQGQDRDEIEMVMANFKDRVDTILAIQAATVPRNMAELMRAIADLFSDQRAKVWLSSIHKAKGLEARRVVLLHPHLLPHPSAKKPWEKEQEMNLKYVALTRATERLTFAYGDEDD
ncbi:ATP-dependent helicase [Nodosilinea sp. FACHB-131]|uniref:UvrD-helicase domain-containing protein n=1 Tax=Cyanophyceae TaxID=3028117 RepID=UPI001682F2E4|nr:ATP-dependent helicase [Nodosilinea sp. FACHB-131]MBD1876951.1 ATP-dependent helicase [Nodosilinea sp. FACHB-131]